MKKKALSLALALVLCLNLLPVTVLAAETSPTDWNFLVLFAPMDADYEEDGAVKYVTTSLSEDEVAVLLRYLTEFGQTLEEAGVVKPHFTNLQMPRPITQLSPSNFGPYPNVEDIAAYLKDYSNIDLDMYDHVIVYARMDGVKKSYGGITDLRTFENGTTTCSFIPAEYSLLDWGNTPKRPAYIILHEFLHTMELRCGFTFDLHKIEEDLAPNYQSDELYKACELDIILNRVKGDHGSGVRPSAWQHTLRELRAMRELTIPNDVTTIGSYQFKQYTNLERVTIPSTVTKIGDHAFQFCSSLSEVTLPSSISSIEDGAFEQCTSLAKITIPSGVTSIGIWAFESCASLREITIPASVTSIGGAAFQNTGLTDVYYGGTEEQWKAIQIGEYNNALTSATIHYNGGTPTQSAAPTVDNWARERVNAAVEAGLAPDGLGNDYRVNIKIGRAHV